MTRTTVKHGLTTQLRRLLKRNGKLSLTPQPRQSEPTYARIASAVAASAGKNDSIDSSLAVTSTAVPNVATVEMKASSPASVLRRGGTASEDGLLLDARGLTTRSSRERG